MEITLTIPDYAVKRLIAVNKLPTLQFVQMADLVLLLKHGLIKYSNEKEYYVISVTGFEVLKSTEKSHIYGF